MQPPFGKSLLIGYTLISIGCLLLIGIAVLWYTQPWLPYTESDIQHALDVHYSDRNPHLRSFWNSYDDCRVAIIDLDGRNFGTVTMYVTMEKKDGLWRVVSDESSAG